MPCFDSTYWGNVYFDALDHFIDKPRDIVRIVNALSVTYPAVAGEVNPVDYVALEFLRLFEPLAYQVIRDNREMFAGHTSCEDFLKLPNMSYVLHLWEQWTGQISGKEQVALIFSSDEFLPSVLEKYMQNGTSSGGDDRVAKRTVKVNPKNLDTLTDIGALEARVVLMLTRPNLSADQRAAGESYLKNMNRIRNGQDTGGFFDDDE